MSGESLTGQDTPVVSDEVQTLNPEQPTTGTTEAQTDGADGGTEVPAQAKTFTQDEVNAIVAREKAREARRALRELSQRQQAPQQQAQPGAQGERPQEQVQQPRITEADIEAHIAQKRATEAKQTFVEKLEDAAERFPDILTAVSDPRLPFTDPLIEFLAESEVGVDMAHRLAKNPKELFSIVGMSPLKAGRELSRIEAELKAKPKATPSKAPDPISPVGSRGSARSSALPSDEDDTATWMRKERERIAKRG